MAHLTRRLTEGNVRTGNVLLGQSVHVGPGRAGEQAERDGTEDDCEPDEHGDGGNDRVRAGVRAGETRSKRTTAGTSGGSKS